jgi:hypothetical protein
LKDSAHVFLPMTKLNPWNSASLSIVSRFEATREAVGLNSWVLLLAWMLCVDFLQAGDAGTASRSDRGISYRNDRIDSAPWSIHVAMISRDEPTLEIRSTLARGTILGLSTVSAQARSIPAEIGTPLAGVNGDFYEREGSTYAGDPRGLQILDGELISAPTGNPTYCAFWIDAEGNPHTGNVVPHFKATFTDGRSFPIALNEERRSTGVALFTPTLGRATRATGGRELILERAGEGPWLPLRPGETYTAKVRASSATGNTRLEKDIMVLSFGPRVATNVSAIAPGAGVTISTATSPDLRGARTAIGGGSVITRGGKKVRISRTRDANAGNSYQWNSMFERHPRAAVGWSKSHLFLVEVDGRQRGLSVGMTLEELGEYMAKLGCEEAINLDGGGSATFWYRGRVVNSPCDGTERAVANGLVIIRKPPTGPGSNQPTRPAESRP